MKSINLTINGKKISKKEVEDYTLLSTFIRENLNLTGTHRMRYKSVWCMCCSRRWKIDEKLCIISC